MLAAVGDAARTRQILLNLLANGIKFTSEGSVLVSVSATLAKNRCYEIHFAVEDSGIGIPASKWDTLFQPFSQVDSSMTRRYGGTGLGLAICKRLSEQMGGRIWLESPPDEGSTFHFTIVGEAAGRPELSYLNRSDPRLAGRRLFIVDGNAMMRRLLSRYTSSWGMRPEELGSAAEALERLRSGESFDVAIIGREVTRRDEVGWVKLLGKDGCCRDLPIVLLTALGGDEGNATKGSEHRKVLNKPFKPAQLFEALCGLTASAGVRLRRADRPAEERLDQAVQDSQRVLLVEDNPVNQTVARHMVRILGYRADLAENGLEALEALEQQPYDLVLMDLQMPKMDGFEAVRLILDRLPRERQPFIVAMTAHTMKGDRERCLEAGMDDYISKPISFKALQAVLERFVPASHDRSAGAGSAGARQPHG